METANRILIPVVNRTLPQTERGFFLTGLIVLATMISGMLLNYFGFSEGKVLFGSAGAYVAYFLLIFFASSH